MCGQMQPNWQTFICNFIVTPIQVTSWKDDENLKQAFGIALAQGFKNSFEAACSIFGKETQKALWASTKWLEDEIVLAAKANYIAVVEPKKKILDKQELLLKLQDFAEARIIFNGNEVFAAEGKDRLKAYELVAKIQGFINDKAEINNNLYQANNRMEIVFVEADKKENVKVLEHAVVEVEDVLENSPIKLKLVG